MQNINSKSYFKFQVIFTFLVLIVNDKQNIKSYLTTKTQTKLLLDSQSFDGEAEVLITRKHYFTFRYLVKVLVLYSIIHMTSSHISL